MNAHAAAGGPVVRAVSDACSLCGGDSNAPLCDRCASIPGLAHAHWEGQERLAGREPLIISASDAGELEWRSWGVRESRGDVGR